MITDHIKNIKLYTTLHPNLAKGFDFLLKTDLINAPADKYDIDGDNVFAIVQEYTTKNLEDASWEAHRKYWDIQYVISGKENMGFSYIGNMKSFQEYNDEKDYELFSGEGTFIEAHSKNFFVFGFDDVHLPGIKYSENSFIKKVVIKVKI